MNRKWQISGIISMPSLFVRYHETLCAADYYEKILDEKNQFSFYRFNSVQYEWLDWDFMVDNFEVPIVPQNRVSGRIDEIKFAKFSNYEKRNTLQNLILTEYVELTRLISLMMQNQSFRCTMYNTDIEQLMPPNVSEDISSYVMLEDIIKTIPNIIDKIARIKINIADDLVSLSASSGDYWKSQKQGAIPALRHLIGSVNSETYDWTPYELPEVNLLYPRTINRPEMTNDLRTAIDFVTRFAPNFLEISETDLEIGKPDFYNVIKSRIHEKANEYQDAANKNRYVLISQLFTEYGVTSLTVNNAIDYIYSHMFMFPRSVEEDINEAGNFYLNWENKYKSIPWFYFTKGLTQIYMYQPADDEMSILPEYLGLANILYKSYNYISSIVSSLDMEDPYEECPYNDNIDKDRAIKIENMRKLHAMDSMRLIDNYTGKIKFNLRIMDSNDNSSRLAVTVNNCSEMIKGFGYADDMDNMYYRFRTYTLDDYEQIDGMAAIVCTEYDNDNVYCSDARQDERNYGLTYNYIVDQCNGQIQDLPVGKDIVIEIGVRKSGYEETKWHPIYVIDKKETENFRVGNNEAKYLRPLLDGEIVSMVRRILSYDQKDLNKPQCLPINGLEDECYDRDWVPAIDNEIIDTSGNQYEQSYRHYLETARIAANQARTLRDELISDIITESQEMFVGQHQEDSAIDSYYNNISEICGNNIAVKKDKVKAVVHEDEDLKTLKSRLEELWSIQDEASALEGEQKLGEYGCAGDDESRFGTVQCSVKRNCKIDGSGAASLKEIMPERVGEFMGMSSTGLQIDYPLNNNTPAASLDELFSKNGLKVNMPSPDDDGYYDLVLKEIDRIDGFLFSSKVAISSMINNMKIYQWPALYPWHNYNKEQSIYGAYYEKLNEIDVMRDDISSAVNHYLNGYDRARIALEKIKSTVNVLRYQYDYQQGTAAAQALMQAVNSAFAQNQFEMSIERPWKNCINEVWTRFGYNGKPPQGYGRYDVQKLLLLLNDRFVNGSISIDGAINLQNRYEAFKKSENWFFYDECVRALHETGHHIIVVNPQHPDIICNGFISNFNSSREHLRKWWIEPKDRMSNCIFQTKSEHLGEGWFVSTVYSKWTNIPFDQMGGHPSPYTPSIYETKEPVHSDPNIIIQLQNFRQDEDYAEARPFTSEYNDPTASCSNYQYRGNSASNNKSNISYYINNTEQAVYPLWMLMIQHEMDKCNAYFGCKPTVYSHSKLDYNDPQCDGLFTDSYKDPIAAQQGLSLELDRLLGNLEVASLSQQLDEIKSLMRETTDGFVIGRNELESSVKRMARKIGELGQLEERQIKELDSLANSLALNKAAKYTSLSDWNERYTYRQEEYKKQLNRAKIAAWTARRAIEFRFGIDLSTETTRSLYGDIPSKWADEIYQMGISKCGDSMLETTDTGDSDTESGNVVKQSKVAECLSPEDRIEDYVQKLEDYVSSYGNTPGQNWWFHEDDDIGIVSVRDHIAVTDVSPSAEVQNLLFFTEELDMTELEFNDIYESIVSGFANPGEVLGNGAELPWPSFWQGNADIQSKTSVTDLLGLPPEVRRAHKANDSHVYEDQKEETTAELIKLYSDDTPDLDVELYQTIDLKDVETEAQLSGKEMQFSAYIIKAPEETVCSAGEVYSGAIGRCGLVCDPTDNPCPYAGQDCVYIGDDSIEVSFMCIWCSADRNCLGQDGTVVQMQMEVEQGGSVVTAAGNVPVTRKWSQNSINTLEDSLSVENGETIGNATVRFRAAETENLVTSSEKIDPEKGWFIDVPGELSEETILSPEGYNVANYALISGIEGTETVGSINYTVETDIGGGFYTASFWIKLVEGSAQEYQTEELSLLADGIIPIANEKEIIDNNWKRVSVSGYAETGVSAIRLRISPNDPSYDGENRIAVWGLQIEKGAHASIYIPTGKNRVASTTLDTEWSKHGEIEVQRALNGNAPDGTNGNSANVFVLSDNSEGNTGYIEYYSNTEESARYITFSVWMRNGESVPAEAAISLGSTALLNPVVNTIVTLNRDWQRFEITADLEGIENIPNLTVKIYPAGTNSVLTGQVEVWGPQAEFNSTATGYRATGSDVNDNMVKWQAKVGIVGTSLVEIGSFGCDELGKPEAVDPPRQCPVKHSNYTRNTYVRKHYSDRYVVNTRSATSYPMPSELAVHLSDKERTRLFKEQFTKVESTDDSPGYYLFRPFNLNMDSISKGSMGMFGVLAANNFNYRLRTVGLNVKGTDVINCDNSDSPSTCAANNWLVYDLKQMGDVYVRNHRKEKSVRPFEIPTGLIKGGKAWAAEQVVGYPISGAHQSMLSQLQKVSLMGRPLEGTYELRIYDTPELAWDKVEDIQLILGYHYWTRSE